MTVGDMPVENLCAVVLDVLCPMHMRLDATGHIRHMGPMLRKICPDVTPGQDRFLEVFELKRPRGATSMQGLLDARGIKLRLRLRDPSRAALQDVLVPLPVVTGGALFTLSFLVSIMEAVRDFNLTNTDFSPTDQTIEILYLLEAKSAVMNATHTLNKRLQGAKIAAEEQAFTDTLTGLKNRRAMKHILDRLTALPEDFAVMQLDLDFFKAVNDNHGHAAGDHVLQHVARIMVAETRAEDTVVRIGGDEFLIILRGAISRRKVAAAAAKAWGLEASQAEKPDAGHLSPRDTPAAEITPDFAAHGDVVGD